MKKNNTVTIGFWLVLGSSKKHPLLVCPALVDDQAIKDIDTTSIQKAWNVSVQTPVESNKNVIMTMIPEIINIANLEKEIKKFESLWEIPAIKAKCEALSKKYIEQFREANKQNNGD